MVVIEATQTSPVTLNEYTLGANSWAQYSLQSVQTGNLGCFMTDTVLFMAGMETAVYDLRSSPILRNSTNYCNSTTTPGCYLIAGNNQVVYTFTGPADNQHLLRYNSTDWVDMGVVNTTISPMESLSMAPDGTLYAAGDGALAKSTNQGLNWTRVLTLATCTVDFNTFCNRVLYASNNVVFLGNFDLLHAFNVSSGISSQLNFQTILQGAGGSAQTVFVLGSNGAVWQTSIVSAGNNSMLPLSTSVALSVNSSFTTPSDTNAVTRYCRVYGISGSVAMGKVYAAVGSCNQSAPSSGSILTANIPAASNWTLFGPVASTLTTIVKGIYAHPLSDDIWIYSQTDVVRIRNGISTSFTFPNSNSIDIISGYQIDSSTAVVYALSVGTVYKADPTTASFIYSGCPGFPAATAVYVSNMTTLFAAYAGGFAVTFDEGASFHPGLTKPSAPNITIEAIYYRRNVDVIIVANKYGLWESVGGAQNDSRTWNLVVNSTLGFTTIWARNDDDIYASGTQLDVIWHFTGGGGNWTPIATPLQPHDPTTNAPDFGVAGIWGTAAGDTYAATRMGVISSPFDTLSPTQFPTKLPTRSPTPPTKAPTPPTAVPTRTPTASPTTRSPTRSPTTRSPTPRPTRTPTPAPTPRPTKSPVTQGPSASPTPFPTDGPTPTPTRSPSISPTTSPTRVPTKAPITRECLCVDDCSYKGIQLGNNGVCEDAGPGGNGFEHPELAACEYGHDCLDCGTANRTGFKDPPSCDPRVKTRLPSNDASKGGVGLLALMFFCLAL